MQRRKFIQLSAIGSAAIGVTGIYCNRHRAFYEVMDNPGQLSHICDVKTIREIGMAYRLQTPAETKADILAALLLADPAGNFVSSSSDNLIIQTLIDQKIKRDFETGNTVMVKGWILAVTEARQCALLSANNQ
jgi:hypothetical protein